MTTSSEINGSVRYDYGQILQSGGDLKTSACCSIDALPAYLKRLLAGLHPEVLERFYGCGLPLPPALEDKTVLDLGCGTGRDCYGLSKLVGPSGRVIGVDMTPEQLKIAERHRVWHAERYGYANVEFIHDHIENLAEQGVKPLGIKGDLGSDWVLLDLGDVIVHAMTAQSREFYQLEKLWSVDRSKEAGQAG